MHLSTLVHFCSVYQHVVCIVYYVHVTLYNSLPLHKTLLGRMRCLGCISNHCNQHCNDSAVHTQCKKHAICTAACVDINQCAWMDLGVGYQSFARVDCVFLCGLSSCAVCCSLSSCVWSSAVGPRGLSSCVCSSWSSAATTLPRSLSICRWTAVIRQNVLDGGHQGDHHDDECHDDDDV